MGKFSSGKNIVNCRKFRQFSPANFPRRIFPGEFFPGEFFPGEFFPDKVYLFIKTILSAKESRNASAFNPTKCKFTSLIAFLNYCVKDLDK